MTLQAKRIFSQKTVTSLVIAYCLSSVISVFLSSYLHYDITESIMFKVDDGLCNPNSEGIGAHCFSDFYAFMNLDLTSSWIEGSSPYPPLAILYYLPFKVLTNLLGVANLALFLHLALMIFCLIFPILHFRFNHHFAANGQKTALAFAVVVSAPSLMVLDRGNNIALTVPFLYLFFLKSLEKNNSALIYGAILTALRPQFAIYILFLVFHKKWKDAFAWIAISVSIYVISFSIFGVNKVTKNLNSWVYNLLNYQPNVALPTFFPSNWSFSNLTSVFASGVNSMLGGGILTPNDSFRLNSHVIGVFSAVFFLFALFVMYLNRKMFSNFEILIMLTLMVLLVPRVTFSYYLVIILIPILFIFSADTALFSNKKMKSNSGNQFVGDILCSVNTKLKRNSMLMVLFSVFIPWSIPWFLVGIPRNESYAVISISWTFAMFVVFIWFLTLLLAKNEKRFRFFP